MGNLFNELKRRNVVRVGIAYIVLSWVALQVGDVLFDMFGTPDWVGKTLAVLLMLSGCATYSVRAPIGDRTQSPARTPDTHQVRRGDTLYSIAFMYGVSVEELADWNQLRAPFTIYGGQELRLMPAPMKPPELEQAMAPVSGLLVITE